MNVWPLVYIYIENETPSKFVNISFIRKDHNHANIKHKCIKHHIYAFRSRAR